MEQLTLLFFSFLGWNFQEVKDICLCNCYSQPCNNKKLIIESWGRQDDSVAWCGLEPNFSHRLKVMFVWDRILMAKFLNVEALFPCMNHHSIVSFDIIFLYFQFFSEAIWYPLYTSCILWCIISLTLSINSFCLLIKKQKSKQHTTLKNLLLAPLLDIHNVINDNQHI